MSNQVKRRALAEQLRWLVRGRITNDQFDEYIYEHGIGSDDPTIDEIAWWAWTLYSDTTTYKLDGTRRPSDETKQAAIRAIVMLRGEQTYCWPTLRQSAFVSCLEAISYLGGFVAIALMLIALLAGGCEWIDEVSVGWVISTWIGAIAIILAPMIWFIKRQNRKLLCRFKAFGDTECWPFRDPKSLSIGRNQGYLLGK